MSTKALFLGATGYLGGSVLQTLKRSYPEVAFTTIIRSSTAISKIREAGAEPVIVAPKDYESIAKLSAEADVVVNVTDADNAELLNALLEGQRWRKLEGKGVGSFIQTSGCNIFLDHSNAGKFDPNGKVWTDSEGDIRSLTTEMDHGHVDVPLLKASANGEVNSFIICPAGIYGTGWGPIRRDSVLFRSFVRDTVSGKKVVCVGDGSNQYEFVHIDDLVSLFDIAFKLAIGAVSAAPSTNPYERYYIASTIHVPWKNVLQGFARVLHKKGLVEFPTPVPVHFEEAGTNAFMFASNITTRPLRAFEIGWKPKHLTFSDEEFVGQVEAALKSLE